MDEVSKFIQESIQTVIEEEIKAEQSTKDIENLSKKLDNIDISDITQKLLKNMSNDIKIDYKQNMYEYVSNFRLVEKEFLARHEYKWNRAFASSEVFYIMIKEAVEKFTEHVDSIDYQEKQYNIYTYIALLHIHGRALQQFLEIITLVKNGFADGAYARWRSMYELTIMAYFIDEHGENTAKAFIESSETEDRYEWARASNIFEHKKGRFISLNDIQKSLGEFHELWEEQYILANRVVHASPQGTFGRLANMTSENVIPIGRSDYGITTAAEHSAISLSQITIVFLKQFHHGDSVLAMDYIYNWVDVIRDNYLSLHEEIFSKDNS